MTNKPDRKIWFPAKRYGWGWGPPVCWQGWVVLVTWIVLLIIGAVRIENMLLNFLFTALMAAVLITICWIKGEKPRWRWGKD